MTTLADFDGKMTHPTMQDPCAKCMFNCISCGTITMCPTSAGGVIVVEGDKVTLTQNHFCFCLRPSPVPCFMGCGFGPCAQTPRFIKVSDTELKGSGESQCGAGMCQPMCHNEGDKMIFKDGKAEWWAGTSPAYPPCFHGKLVATVDAPTGGSPVVAEMER